MIEKHETKLVGSKKFDGSTVVNDEITKRIELLASSYLRKIAQDASGWDILYQDPEDGRYWELIYPESELQGAGPPLLNNLSAEEAKKKYY